MELKLIQLPVGPKDQPVLNAKQSMTPQLQEGEFSWIR